MNHLDELQALVELARSGNLRRAAEARGISQSTLSECVTRLESSYGAALFTRDRRGSRPTLYGELVVNAAEQALRVLGEAHREIGLIKGSASGRLAIGAEPGLIEPYLTGAIVRGLVRFPRLRYRLHALDSSTLVQELRARRIEFFLGVTPDVSTGGLELNEIGELVAVPFVRRDHPLAGAKKLGLGELLRFPIVQGPGPRWFVRRLADEMRQDAGAGERQLNAAVVVNDFGVVRAIIRQTDAIGFAGSAMLQGAVERGAFVALDLSQRHQALLRLPMVIGMHERRSLPPAAVALIEEVRAVIAETTGHHSTQG